MVEGCNGEQSEVSVTTDFGCDTTTSSDPLHMFRISSHPTGALQTSISNTNSCSGVPSVHADLKSTERTINQLGNLSLGDPSSSGYQRHSPCHVIPPLHGDTSSDGDGMPYPCTVTSLHRSPSPTSSVASIQSASSSSFAGEGNITKAHRARFLVFIKILFKCLDQANEHQIRDQAKKIVAECTRRNRMGDPNFTPLIDAVEKRLRRFVGESHWRKASLLLRHFAAKHNGFLIQPTLLETSSDTR